MVYLDTTNSFPNKGNEKEKKINRRDKVVSSKKQDVNNICQFIPWDIYLVRAHHRRDGVNPMCTIYI